MNFELQIRYTFFASAFFLSGETLSAVEPTDPGCPGPLEIIVRPHITPVTGGVLSLNLSRKLRELREAEGWPQILAVVGSLTNAEFTFEEQSIIAREADDRMRKLGIFNSFSLLASFPGPILIIPMDQHFPK